MKKNQIFSILTALALFSATTANAGHHHDVDPTPSERTSTLMSFGVMGVLSALIHKGGDVAGLSGASKGILHTANVLYQLGQISEKPVLKDLGSRALLAGAASKMASTDMMRNELVPYIPFIGASLKEAGGMGVGIMTVSLYSVLGAAFEAAKERTGLGDYLNLH